MYSYTRIYEYHMSIYMYIYICLCLYTYVNTFKIIHSYTHIYKYIGHMNVDQRDTVIKNFKEDPSVKVYIFVCFIHMYMYINLYKQIHVFVNIQLSRIHIYIYIFTSIYPHLFIHMCRFI
jgi:hypothetical protein